ncbi:MFS transporter [Arthrobacter roseus]
MRGRLLVLAGILTMAFSMRLAVTSTPPLFGHMRPELVIDTATGSILGLLPTVAFALFAIVVPYLARRATIELLAVASLILTLGGQFLRAMVSDVPTFMVLTLVALAGMGMGNVLLPPLVKRYFRDRVGLVTAIYVTLIAASTAIPPLIAVPVAEAAGWRFSIDWWAIFPLAALIPMLLTWLRTRTTTAPGQAGIAPPSESRVRVNAAKSPAAWGLVLMMGMTSLNSYAMFTWLPTFYVDQGMSPAAAGGMLALFAFVGMPVSIVVPVLAARMRNQLPIALFAAAAFAIGYAGMLYGDVGHAWIWVIIVGFGQATFALSLVMMNLRTRTHEGSVALSGFSQGLGYVVAGLGPLLFASLHELTGTWTASFGVLWASLVLLVFGAVLICRPKMLEDYDGVVRTAEAPTA